MNEQLNIFRQEYHNTRVTQHEDRLVYKTFHNNADKASESANALISLLNLNLVAIPTKHWPKESFIITIKK